MKRENSVREGYEQTRQNKKKKLQIIYNYIYIKSFQPFIRKTK